MKIKYCKDCKWYEDEKMYKHVFQKCLSPNGARAVNLITGEERKKYKYCDMQREDDWLWSRMMGTCGKEGRFFEPKKKVKKC